MNNSLSLDPTSITTKLLLAEKMASNVVRATVFATKRAGTSNEEFSRRFAKHGLLAGKVMLKYNVISYHQVSYLSIDTLKLLPDTNQQHRKANYESEFKTAIGPAVSAFFDFIDADGLITMVFPTMADFAGFFADPAHKEYLNADVAEYATLGTVRISLGHEYRVVDNGALIV